MSTMKPLTTEELDQIFSWRPAPELDPDDNPFLRGRRPSIGMQIPADAQWVPFKLVTHEQASKWNIYIDGEQVTNCMIFDFLLNGGGEAYITISMWRLDTTASRATLPPVLVYRKEVGLFRLERVSVGTGSPDLGVMEGCYTRLSISEPVTSLPTTDTTNT